MISEARQFLTYLIDVGTLDLRHSNEVICQQQPVVCTYTSHLRQALIRIEKEFFTLGLKLLRILAKHETESSLLIFQKLVFASD